MLTQIQNQPPPGIQLTHPLNEDQARVLTPGALEFIADLEHRFRRPLYHLMQARSERQARLSAGERPDFLPETEAVRRTEWRIAGTPADLQDRRVEITGPVDRKMIINALNSGAKVYMADFEDSHSPTWSATLEGQINLIDAVNRSIVYNHPDGREYRLNDQVATLMVRPRGLHLPERHLLLDGEPVSAALFDFGLYLFHNAYNLLQRGTGPYFYLPKMESHREARWWNQVFAHAESTLGLAPGTIKCTVLIETILAAFEMDEILYELRPHITGLNCGRWDYIFSFIKRFHANPEWVLPDRAEVTMTSHFLRSYSWLLVRTCHRRGAHAMGGMAAQIPIRDDPEADATAKDKVRKDKEREVSDGHDGTWVAHPGLVPVALEVFDRAMPEPNQIDRPGFQEAITADDLLALPPGRITEAGVRNNICAAVRYIAAWLGGHGAVPIHHLMEDAATAEIARAQLWQWVRYPKGVLDDGRKVTREMFEQFLAEELEAVAAEYGTEARANGRYDEAAALLSRIVLQDRFEEFLTLPAYQMLD